MTKALDDDACYLALKARDARFDGRFFTGVTSTGVYCRPVCAVQTPRRDNCRFFPLAAQAEAAGFRPCLRCRPELAPQGWALSLQGASNTLAHQALQWLQSPQAWASGPPRMAALAQRMGVTDRHLRRIFQAAFGLSPSQYAQTHRLLAAKQMLTDTDVPVTQVALACGFASVRAFNAAFAQHYRLQPTALRRSRATPSATPGLDNAANRPSRQTRAARGAAVQSLPLGDGHAPAHGPTVRLGWRPPLDAMALLGFFAARQIDGMECVHAAQGTLRRTVQLPRADGASTPLTGWISAHCDPARCTLHLVTSASLHPALPQVIARVRALFDLDADPAAIAEVLHPHFPHGDGLRVPGAWEGFELAVRAVLGQHISVAAARTLATRLVQRFGAPMATPWPGVQRLFPTPAVLAQASGDALGALGIVRTQQAAITALAQAVYSGALVLQPGQDVAATTAQLTTLAGVGDWTAHYIAMRALRWPDALLAGDVALHQALGLQGAPHPAAQAARIAQAWRPWRAYGVIRAWQTLQKQ